jgi:ABC-2 type transport system ATP-binding protein
VPAVELHAVTKTYTRRGRPPQRALDDLHLVVETGGVHGFLGPNGSGKTTTIRVLLGLVRPDAGEVRLLDRPPGSPAPGWRRCWRPSTSGTGPPTGSRATRWA